MPSLYDLVFSQSQPENEISSRDDGCPNDNDSVTLEDDVFRKEAREALMRRKQEDEKMVDLGDDRMGKKKRPRIHARPTMYRTEEEKKSLRKSYWRSAYLAKRAKDHKWNYDMENTNDADTGDVIFQTLAAEQQLGDRSSSDVEEEHVEEEHDADLPVSKEKSTVEKSTVEEKVHPRRIFGPGKNTFQWYTINERILPPTLRSVPTKFWPLVVDGPKWKRQNPIDYHLNQLSFIAARLLLNACGSTASPSRHKDTGRNNHPTVLTMDTIEHLYHAPRDPTNQSYGLALRFALTLIPSSTSDIEEVRSDAAADRSQIPLLDHEYSWHDLLQKQINETLSLWRDYRAHAIWKRKEKYLRNQKENQDEKKGQGCKPKRRSRKDQLRHDRLNDKTFIDVYHLTPCNKFLHIFEMTLSLFLCILGDILLSEQDENLEESRHRYQDDDEDDDGIYNIASLYQEDEGTDDEFSPSSFVKKCEMAFKNYCFDFRKYAKEKFAIDHQLNLMSYPQFMAVQRVQSFVCNSGISKRSVDEAAKELVEIGNDILDEPQLRKHFGDLHVTTGIAMIVSSLCSINTPSSSSAAAIVSSACNSRAELLYRTPFDIMRRAFQQLNTAEDISDSLEAAASDMYTASHVFETCYLNEPNNLNAHVWHLASLLGGLILSSGKLCLFYGASPAHNLNDYTRGAHDKLMNIKFRIYESFRKEASTAFIQLQNKIKSSEINMMMSSLLEWSEAIYLLCCFGTAAEFNSISQLHAWYTIHWSKNENTTFALNRVRELHKNRLVTTNTFLAILADCIEQHPSNTALWVELFLYLSSSTGIEQSTVHKKDNPLWWGFGRTWWQYSFLEAPNQCFPPEIWGSKDGEDDDSFEFLDPETLMNSSFFSLIVSSCFTPAFERFHAHSSGVDFSTPLPVYVEWLRSPDDEFDNLYIEEGENENDLYDAFQENIRRLLPKHWQEFICREDRECDDHIQRLISELNSCSLKAFFVKIAIAFYLFDHQNSFVHDSIIWLFEQADKQRGRGNGCLPQLGQCIEGNIALEVLSFFHHYYGVDAKAIRRYRAGL